MHKLKSFKVVCNILYENKYRQSTNLTICNLILLLRIHLAYLLIPFPNMFLYKKGNFVDSRGGGGGEIVLWAGNQWIV